MSKDTSKRVIIIGIDGAPYRLIEEFTSQGVMSNLKNIIEKGIFRKMQSSIPDISSVAWSSIITGKNPAEHGIFGFTDFPEGTYRLSFPNYNSLKVPAFWNQDKSKHSIVVNVPSTYPAGEINGLLISGFVALDLERSVYPQTYLPTLKEMEYEVDVDSSLAHKSMELFLKNLDKTLNKRIELFHHLWQNESWDNFMFVFTGSDRLFHFLWDAYEDKGHQYHQVYLEHFKKIDAVIGEISSSMKDDDILIILSDHGFERLYKNININYLLKQEGLLTMKEGTQGNFNDIDYGTKVFAMDPARIYINLADKYPCGSVAREDYNKVINEVKELFNTLEIDGKKVVQRIYHKDEVFKGPLINQAPDLVLMGESGMNLKASMVATTLAEDNIFTGKHTQHDAFFIINDKSNEAAISDGFSVSDVQTIIEKYKGGIEHV